MQGSIWNKNGSKTEKHGPSKKGFLYNIAGNTCNALDESWYSQLKHVHTTYRNVQPIQILEHLNTQWCPLDVHTKKLIKAKYWTKWDGSIHLTAFGKRFDDEQNHIKCFGINISNEDKLQFYLERMYFCNQFDQTQMTTWENKTEAIKTDWTETKQYFEGLVHYKQSSTKDVHSQRLTVYCHSVGLSTKNEQELRLGMESMVKKMDPLPLTIPDRQSKMLGGFGD
jgi:hypothetical protein